MQRCNDYYIRMIVENTTAILKRLSRATMKSDRSPEEIEFVAASGSVSVSALKEAADISFRFFGADSVPAARDKIVPFREVERAERYCGVQWHLTGPLRKEEVKEAVALFDLIHTVDSLLLAEEIDRRAAEAGKVQRILVQVRLADPEGPGVPGEELFPLLEGISALKNVRLEGLMTASPASEDPAQSRSFFRKLCSLRDEAVTKGFSLPHLSMGVCHDFEVGIEEGATLVQVDSILFGKSA
ncbi:MAG: YggS family pyridoxal phosphate-dependent enzyme [Alphaproteobacteria bacterium]|uniref:YggS family pyridoxal phosphate-dependent enzyme n=1 Tax=Candidatus Nitrobium versatile TaxID=2884831 RepID=A0A953M2E2_9BACT|nr:YggS family pyridoxal phosphate-dependent enzyme [Candidatus Nitrobium versatile]